MAGQSHDATMPAPQPPHVPDSLVYDFDQFNDPALKVDPFARVRELLGEAPAIFWTPRNGGHWVLASYEANFEAGRASDLFSSAIIPPEMAAAMRAAMPEGAPRIPQLKPIFLDPPEHGKYRTPLNSSFSPKTMNALQDKIRALARELVGAVAAKGSCEFMSAIAIPLPVHVFLKLMGLPLERMHEYRALANELIAGANDPPDRLMQRTLRILAAMRETIVARQQQPRSDLISMLWSLQIDGRAVTLEEIEDFSILLFIAGLDTVMNAMGHAARHLAMHPGLQRQLRDDPGLVAEAKEELLRLHCFVVPPRRIARDATFLGVEMKAGDRVFMFLPGAGLDPARYEEPDAFRFDRSNIAHLAFNSGPHRCLGANLARIELQVVLEELLAGLPQFGVDPEHPPEFACGQNLGVASLHLLWNSAPANGHA